MPEGDTIFQTAVALRPILVGREVLAARARVPGPAMERHDEDGPAGNVGPPRLRLAIVYGAMVVGAVGLFLLNDDRRRRLDAPASAQPRTRDATRCSS